MIASNKRNSLRITHLEGKKKKKRLNTVIASIDEVTHEQVVCIRALSSNFEKLFEVIELAVNVSADLYKG